MQHAPHVPGRLMTAALRGRPSAERFADVRDDLAAERAESVALAELALSAANRIHHAVPARRPDVVLHEAGRIGVAAGRFLMQRGAA